jgi:head-tail adaptor
MLTATDLDAMRSTLDESLPDTAQVGRQALVSDDAGGFSESWSVVATVACRVSPGGLLPQERAVAERMGVVSSWVVTLPALTDVRAADRLVVGTRTFEVVAPLGPRSYEVSRRVVCSEVG